MSRPVRLPPVSIRLNAAERAFLERRAGGLGLSTYIKSVVLAAGRANSGNGRRTSTDHVLLAQILGQLGASGLASSLHRLAAAADTGSLYVDDLTIHRLHDACDDIRGIHLHLLKAMGKKVPKTRHNERLTVKFLRAAADSEGWR